MDARIFSRSKLSDGNRDRESTRMTLSAGPKTFTLNANMRVRTARSSAYARMHHARTCAHHDVRTLAQWHSHVGTRALSSARAHTGSGTPRTYAHARSRAHTHTRARAHTYTHTHFSGTGFMTYTRVRTHTAPRRDTVTHRHTP